MTTIVSGVHTVSRSRDFAPAHPAFTAASGTPQRGANAPAMLPTERHVTAEIGFAGHGADGDTVTFEIWLVRAAGDQFEVFSLGTGTATLGAVVADAGSIYEGARLADEVVFTPGSYLTYLEGLVNAPHRTFSPGDGTLALLGFPDLGGQVAGIVVEITGGTAIDGNAYVALWT